MSTGEHEIKEYSFVEEFKNGQLQSVSLDWLP